MCCYGFEDETAERISRSSKVKSTSGLQCFVLHLLFAAYMSPRRPPGMPVCHVSSGIVWGGGSQLDLGMILGSYHSPSTFSFIQWKQIILIDSFQTLNETTDENPFVPHGQSFWSFLGSEPWVGLSYRIIHSVTAATVQGSGPKSERRNQTARV